MSGRGWARRPVRRPNAAAARVTIRKTLGATAPPGTRPSSARPIAAAEHRRGRPQHAGGVFGPQHAYRRAAPPGEAIIRGQRPVKERRHRKRRHGANTGVISSCHGASTSPRARISALRPPSPIHCAASGRALYVELITAP